MDQTILLVDDETAVTEGLKRALRREKYKILTAASAEQALKLLSAIQVDLVVTDERMPGMRGGQLLAYIREHHPDTMRIMLSGYPTLDIAVDAINRGEIYRLFCKPCNEIELALGIRDALKHKALVTQTRKLVKLVHEHQECLRGIALKESRITKDSEGAIVLPEASEELDEVLRQVEAELDD